MWRETETAKVFTYQGLTTCTELDKSWTIMSSIYNHLRQGRDKSISELKFFIRAEVELQERLETMGYRSPTRRLLRALQSLLSAVQLQGESAVTAPPFSPSAGRGTTKFWGKRLGPTVFLWRATFLIKVKSHRGEPINERADTLAGRDEQFRMTTKDGMIGLIG